MELLYNASVEQMNQEVARVQNVEVPSPPPLQNVTEPETQRASSTARSLLNLQALQRSVQEQSLLLREQERLLRQRRLRFDDNDSDLPEGSRSRDSDVSSTHTESFYELHQFPTDFETAGYHH